MMSITRSSLLAFTLTIAATFCGIAQAAETQEPALVSLLQIQTAPGRGPALEAYIRKAIEANNQVGSNVYWTTTQTAIGDITTYGIIRQVTSFAELAPPAEEPIVAAFGPEAAAGLMDALAPNVTSVRSAVWVHRPDLSRPPAERDTPPPLLHTILMTTKPGAAHEFEEYATKVGEAAREQNWPNHWDTYAPLVGAGTDYGIVLPRWSYEELDTPAQTIPDLLEEQFGRREATRLLEIASDTILSMESSLNTIRPDLSRQPAAAEEAMSETVTGRD
jgi:hypothetical protein